MSRDVSECEAQCRTLFLIFFKTVAAFCPYVFRSQTLRTPIRILSFTRTFDVLAVLFLHNPVAGRRIYEAASPRFADNTIRTRAKSSPSRPPILRTTPYLFHTRCRWKGRNPSLTARYGDRSVDYAIFFCYSPTPPGVSQRRRVVYAGSFPFLGRPDLDRDGENTIVRASTTPSSSALERPVVERVRRLRPCVPAYSCGGTRALG